MKIKFLDHQHIPDFQSGSGLEFHDENIYLTDLSSKQLLVLTQKWKELERIDLFSGGDHTHAHPDHKDLEAYTVIEINKIPRLLALGANSEIATRYKAILLNLDDRTREDFDIGQFDERLKELGLEELNIKSAAIILGRLVLGNRAKTPDSQNNFIVTDIELWKKQDTEEISLLPVKYPDDTPHGIALSGMCYSSENDWLILTFTSEDASDLDTPARSFLGLVENASRKVARKQVKINELMDLGDVNKRLKGHVIKSVCLQSDKNGKIKLYLSADHHEGGLHIFKIRVKH
jgi:hypothetical protein